MFFDWPGLLFPIWLALLSPPKSDTLRTELKPIKFERTENYVNVSCTIKVKQKATHMSEDGLVYTYQTECGDIINTTKFYSVGDIIIRRKKKGQH